MHDQDLTVNLEVAKMAELWHGKNTLTLRVEDAQSLSLIHISTDCHIMALPRRPQSKVSLWLRDVYKRQSCGR